MTQQARTQSVVVGIDGSQAALDAATWAVAEAVSRGVPLRLVHVSLATHAVARLLVVPWTSNAPNSLVPRRDGYQRHGKAGPSRNRHPARASRLCAHRRIPQGVTGLCRLGGKGPCARMPLGSTAAALVRHAHCPVAIVRSSGTPQTDSGWIAAVQNDESDNDAVVHRAMEEGRLRRAPVLLIDMRLDSWVRRYPDVHVQTVAARRGGTRREKNRSDSIQLAVVGSADAEHVARLVWPDYHPVLGDANRSVLFVRH